MLQYFFFDFESAVPKKDFEFDSNRDSGMDISTTGAQELQKNRKDCTKTERTARILTHEILSVLYVLEVPV